MNRVFPISAIVLLGTLTAAAAEEASKLADLPKLTVRGDAELEKPADQVRLRVSVVTDAEEALGANSRRMRDVTQAIGGHCESLGKAPHLSECEDGGTCQAAGTLCASDADCPPGLRVLFRRRGAKRLHRTRRLPSMRC